MSKKAEVFIVDDHNLLVEGLTELALSAGFGISGVANDGRSALQAILRNRPDVTLLDLDLPEMDGLDVLQAVLKKWPEARIIIMTMHLERSLIEKAVQYGAKGYLPKNVDRQEFVMAIKNLAAGRCHYAEDAVRSLAVSEEVPSAGGFHALSAIAELTDREVQVLKAIAEGLSNKATAERLHLSSHTIDSHRKNIMRKLEVHHTAGLIRAALKAGLVE